LFLREYIYVDQDKVRGIISQILEGVPESAKSLERSEKDAELKNRQIGGFGKKSADEESSERSMADSLFKILEDELEALTVLRDISKELNSSSDWEALAENVRPGSVVRITAPGKLFHPNQLSHALVGIATAAHGVASFSPESSPAQTPPGKNRPGNKRSQRQAPFSDRGDSSYPEDLLPSDETLPLLDLPREQVAGLIRLVRGIYDDGVHLNLRPRGKEGPFVSARLESGRRYLDSSPEILFSRYGLSDQDWTIVGIVGQFGRPESDSDEPVLTQEGRFDRSAMIDLVDNFLSLAGASGLVDAPTYPGFTVIPLAVYRSIGWTDLPDYPDGAVV
jgi:hypothetical protein